MNVGQCVSPALRSPCGRRAGETRCPTFMVPLQVAVNVEALHEPGLTTPAPHPFPLSIRWGEGEHPVHPNPFFIRVIREIRGSNCCS